MSINFDNTPDNSGGFKPVGGIYKAKVVKATMTAPKSKNADGTEKPKYMKCEYELFDINGEKKGKMWDNFFESEAQALQFKIGRLNIAAKLRLRGAVELADIARIIPNREFVVSTKVTEDGKYLEADLFGGDIFWPVEEFQEVYLEANPDDMFSDSTATAPTQEAEQVNNTEAPNTTGGNY